MSDLKTSIKINLAGNLERQSKRYTRSVEQFSKRSERHISRLGRTANSVSKALDNLGNRYTAVLAGGLAAFKTKQAVEESAKLDKELIKIAQTAGMTLEVTNRLRESLFNMAQQTGAPIEQLIQGFNNLVQSGQSWESSMSGIEAINKAIAVTGSSADVLASALGVAKENFGFDLSSSKTTTLLLDQMTVAGRLGNAELEDLSGIFAKVGNNAKSANLNLTETLAITEAFSLSERSPDRLATLVDSTLRVFTNQNYSKKASKVTGVRFYNADGDKRAAFDVLEDIGKKYKTLKTDFQRDSFLGAAFEGADLDTVKGLRKLFDGDTISGIRQMAKELESAGGAIAKDLPDAINNSVDQVARLKTALRSAADDFSQPINDVIKDGIKFLLDEKSLSGKEILAGGAATVAGGVAAAKLGSAVLSKVGGLASGLAVGKAVEQAGVTPVYVVNMPVGGDLMPGSISSSGKKRPKVFRPGNLKLLGSAPDLKTISMMGAGAVSTAALAVASSAAAGVGIGTLINKTLVEGTAFQNVLGRSIAQALAALGNNNAQAALKSEQQFQHKIAIEFDDKRASVKQIKSSSKNAELDVAQTYRAGPHFGAAM